MAERFSEEWVAQLDRTAGNDAALASAAAGHHLVVEQVVTHGEGPGSCWHVVIDDGSVRFRPGPAEAPTVRFTVEGQTAEQIAEGRLSPTEAFMAGRFRVGGDTAALAGRGELLAALNSVFAREAGG